MTKQLNTRIARRRALDRGADARPKPADPAQRISELVKDARANWYGLLGYLAFVGIALLPVEDADFFIEERQTQLPLIDISVPTGLFFAIAPGLGAMLYINLHLYLMKLWRDLARAEPKVGDDYLSDRISPWLVADFALKMRRDGALRPGPLKTLSFIVTLILVYLAAPVVIAAFWWRSMAKHDEVLTCLFIGVPLFLSIYAGVASFLRLRQLLERRGDGRIWTPLLPAIWALVFVFIALAGWFRTEGTLEAYVRWEPTLERPDSPLPIDRVKIRLRSVYPTYDGLIDTTMPFVEGDYFGRFRTRMDDDQLEDRILKLTEMRVENLWFMRTPYPDWLAPQRLSGEAFVETPAGWLDRETSRERFRADFCKTRAIPAEACGPPPETDVERPPYEPEQRRLWCEGMLGPKPEGHQGECAKIFATFDEQIRSDWDLQRTNDLIGLPDRALSGHDLRNADLSGARMEGADLSGVRMEGANLSGARMEGVDLQGAQMNGADLSYARMEGVYLYGASMAEADFRWARMEGADFRWARMEGANLYEALMEGANFSGTRMEGADFSKSRMETANLDEARMEWADLYGTWLEGANLSGARMEGADFSEARMEGADLTFARMDENTLLTDATLRGASVRSVTWGNAALSRDQILSMFGDASVTLPGGVGPNHPDWPKHWPVWELDGVTFETEWRKWRADPDGYVPPPPPPEAEEADGTGGEVSPSAAGR